MEIQKFKTEEEAKEFAKTQSIHSDEYFAVIQCFKTKAFYVDTDSLIRNFEKLIAEYHKGKKTK